MSGVLDPPIPLCLVVRMIPLSLLLRHCMQSNLLRPNPPLIIVIIIFCSKLTFWTHSHLTSAQWLVSRIITHITCKDSGLSTATTKTTIQNKSVLWSPLTLTTSKEKKMTLLQTMLFLQSLWNMTKRRLSWQWQIKYIPINKMTIRPILITTTNK